MTRQSQIFEPYLIIYYSLRVKKTSDAKDARSSSFANYDERLDDKFIYPAFSPIIK